MNPKIKELLEQASKLSDNHIEVQEIIDIYFSNGSKFTIADLRNGKVAVINDGTLEELREVLRLAFPIDRATVEGWDKYYYALDNKGIWTSEIEKTTLPTQSVKDFLKKENMQTS